MLYYQIAILQLFFFALLLCSTLVYWIEVQAQINVQVGEFLKINKHTVQNKRAGETPCKKISNVQVLIGEIVWNLVIIDFKRIGIVLVLVDAKN